MARRRTKRRNVVKQREKNPIHLRNRVLLHTQEIKPRHQIPLNLIQDNRKKIDNYPKTISGRDATIIDSRITKNGKINKSSQRSKISFADPVRVVACKRRSRRRQELFRLKKVGRGKRVSKRRKYTEDSKVRC